MCTGPHRPSPDTFTYSTDLRRRIPQPAGPRQFPRSLRLAPTTFSGDRGPLSRPGQSTMSGPGSAWRRRAGPRAAARDLLSAPPADQTAGSSASPAPSVAVSRRRRRARGPARAAIRRSRPPRRYTPRCSTRASISARSAPCTACSPPNAQVRERRNQLRHPHYAALEFPARQSQSAMELGHHQAPRPGQVDLLLSLRDPRRLYPLRHRLDGGQPRERRVSHAPHRSNRAPHDVPPGQLNIHADRGRVMISKPVAFLMSDLGVTKTHADPTSPMTTHTRRAVPHPQVPP